ncbi:MAG: hypothetical protein EBT33_03085 [Betaproteobacteria bacterium]|nr:hypothetical protein [Betaproteobacteria bacterium]
MQWRQPGDDGATRPPDERAAAAGATVNPSVARAPQGCTTRAGVNRWPNRYRVLLPALAAVAPHTRDS